MNICVTLFFRFVGIEEHVFEYVFSLLLSAKVRPDGTPGLDTLMNSLKT
jgi:hypothetical protein